MSWLSKGLKSAGKGLKKVGKNVGKAWEAVDDYVLPAAGFALGGPAGAALGSAAARGIGDGKFNAGATLGAGLKGYAGGQLAQGMGLVGGKGVGGLLKSGQGLLPGGGGASAVNGGVAAQAAGGGAMKSVGGSGFGGMARGAMDWASKNPELLLGGISAIQGSRQQAKADELQKRALGLAEQPWNETAGLRAQALQGLMNPQEPDLSGLFAGSSNPFARPSGFSRLRSVGR